MTTIYAAMGMADGMIHGIGATPDAARRDAERAAEAEPGACDSLPVRRCSDALAARLAAGWTPHAALDLRVVDDVLDVREVGHG